LAHPAAQAIFCGAVVANRTLLALAEGLGPSGNPPLTQP